MTITHLSYSQYNTYTNCPRSWYLGKKVQAEEKQTWYLPIGTAVHNMIEDWLEHKMFPGQSKQAPGYLPSAESFFYPLIEKQLLIEPDMGKWLAGGPEANPIVEDLALQQVKDCFEKALEFLDEIDVWEVEYDATGCLPGLEVPVKAYVDIIGEHKEHGPVILDWKTGSQKPKTNFQLETYAAVLDHNAFKHPLYTTDWFTGLWAMLKPGASKARPIDLGVSNVDPAEVGAKYQKALNGMKARMYSTNQGYNCKMCFHQENCLVGGGTTDRSVYYDRSSEDGFPY